MKSQNAIEIANKQGRFMLYYNNGEYTRIANELFSKDSDVSFKMHDKKIFARGFESVYGAFEEMEKSSGLFGDSNSKELHMINSPIIKVSARELSAQVVWTTLGFVLKDKLDGVSSEPIVTRFDADYVKEDGEWKILHMEWYIFLSLNPWNCPKTGMGDWYTKSAKISVPDHRAQIKAEDWWEIIRLQNRYSHSKRKNAAEMFSQSDDASYYIYGLTNEKAKGYDAIVSELKRIDDLEAKQNEKLYLSTILDTNPVIEIAEDGEHANGTWLGLSIGIEGPAFGNSAPYPISVKLICLNQAFVKENGKWKFLRFCASLLFSAPEWHFDPSSTAGLISHDRAWHYPPEETNAGTTDDFLEIENIQGWWVNSLKTGYPSQYVDKLVAVTEEGVEYHTHDPFLESDNPGFLKKANNVVGAKGVEYFRRHARLIEEIKAPQPHHPSCHTTTTPMIVVDNDGKHATAFWFDFGWTLFAEGFNLPPEKWHANPAFARYAQQYIKDKNGRWKIWKFSWYPIFRFDAMWPFVPEGIRGWAGSNTEENWPMPFEKYINEDI